MKHHPDQWLRVRLAQITLVVSCTVWALAEYQLIGPPGTVIAVAGDDVILPCSLNPPLNAEKMTVEWSRPGLDDKYVLRYRDGRNVFQHPSYQHKTALFLDQLKNGNVSLKLFRVRLEDAGNYTCHIPTQDKVKRVIQLIVGAVPVCRPKISILGSKGTSVVLQCESEGWSPEPEVEWRESEGRVLSAEETQTEKDADNRYTVRRNVTVKETDSNRFTCRVQLRLSFNVTMEEEIHVPGGLFQKSRIVDVDAVVAFGSCLVLVIGLIILLNKNKEKHAVMMEKHAVMMKKKDELIELLESQLARCAHPRTANLSTAHPRTAHLSTAQHSDEEDSPFLAAPQPI